MRLLITTPGQIAADHADVSAVEAEDETGCFGIWPRHADFITALSLSVIAWRHADGRRGYCAVRGGLLTVRGGRDVAIATREAVVGGDLAALEASVRASIAAEAEEERRARSHTEQLRVQVIRQMIGYLRPQPAGGAMP